MPFPIAPPRERRIVAKIEELFSDLDAGVAALERAKAKLKRYRATVLKAAVEGKLTEEWRAEHPPKETAAQLLERILKERRRNGNRSNWLDSRRLARSPRPIGKRNTRNRSGLTIEPSGSAGRLVLGDGGTVLISGNRWSHVPAVKPFRLLERQYPLAEGRVTSNRQNHGTKERIRTRFGDTAVLRCIGGANSLIGMIGSGNTRGQVSILGHGRVQQSILLCSNLAVISVPMPTGVHLQAWSQYGGS